MGFYGRKDLPMTVFKFFFPYMCFPFTVEEFNFLEDRKCNVLGLCQDLKDLACSTLFLFVCLFVFLGTQPPYTEKSKLYGKAMFITQVNCFRWVPNQRDTTYSQVNDLFWPHKPRQVNIPAATVDMYCRNLYLSSFKTLPFMQSSRAIVYILNNPNSKLWL